jgi:hypothetical protein
VQWWFNFFMNKFRKLGFIDYNGGLKINNSLLTVVLRDWSREAAECRPWLRPKGSFSITFSRQPIQFRAKA